MRQAEGVSLRQVKITLDEDLAQSVDKVVEEHKTTRAAFVRDVLRKAINQLSIAHLEEKHRKGYKRHPVTKHEFNLWEKEQDWGD